MLTYHRSVIIDKTLPMAIYRALAVHSVHIEMHCLIVSEFHAWYNVQACSCTQPGSTIKVMQVFDAQQC
jgi:hypothetical protein